MQLIEWGRTKRQLERLKTKNGFYLTWPNMALIGNQNISFGLSFKERKTDKEGRREEREKRKKGREE